MEVLVVAGIAGIDFVVLAVAGVDVDRLYLQLARPSCRNALRRAWQAV